MKYVLIDKNYEIIDKIDSVTSGGAEHYFMGRKQMKDKDAFYKLWKILPKKEYDLNKFIILFPFCSPHLIIKKWPHYNKFIELVKNKYNNEYKVLVAPGPLEIPMTKDINAVTVLNDQKALTISELASLIKDSSYVVANDTGPAHMAAHLGVKGLTLFGSHTTAYKVSIERENFKAIQVADLNKLTPEKVFEKFVESLN